MDHPGPAHHRTMGGEVSLKPPAAAWCTADLPGRAHMGTPQGAVPAVMRWPGPRGGQRGNPSVDRSGDRAGSASGGAMTTLYGFKGALPARQRQVSAQTRQGRVAIEGMRDLDGHHQGQARKRWPLSDSGAGGHVAASRTEALTGAPPPPGRPCSAGWRYPPLRRFDGRACKDRAWPVLRAGHPLAVQDLGTYRKDGVNREGPDALLWKLTALSSCNRRTASESITCPRAVKGVTASKML
jgi:hypothetical protein